LIATSENFIFTSGIFIVTSENFIATSENIIVTGDWWTFLCYLKWYKCWELDSTCINFHLFFSLGGPVVQHPVLQVGTFVGVKRLSNCLRPLLCSVSSPWNRWCPHGLEIMCNWYLLEENRITSLDTFTLSQQNEFFQAPVPPYTRHRL
jgi:hypothetical protein